MATFKNNTGYDVVVGNRDSGPLVKAGDTIDVEGAVKETDDAFLVGKGDDQRAWPKAVWSQVKSTNKGSDDK